MTALPLGVTPRQGTLAILGGLLGAAAFWPLSLWPLLPVSIVLLLWLLRDQDAQTARNIGLVYGLTFAAGTMYWMFWIFGVFAVPLLALMAGYFGLLATLIGLTQGWAVPARVALVALFAVAIEWLRGDAWYLRFPWYTPPHALAAAPPCIAAARWLGTYGLSFLVWLFAAAGTFGRPYWFLAFLLLPLGWFLLPLGDPADRQVLLVQTEQPEGVEQLIPRLPTENVDLVVFPELSYLCSPKIALQSRPGPAQLAQALSAPVVFGAVEGTYGQMPFYNVAAVVGPDGTLQGTFPKQRPVPLLADGVPGDRQPVFPVADGVLGVAICYDFDAPAVAGALTHSGATVLVAPTMDALAWTRAQHEHHALLFRLRAVENDRWVLRASSSGRTEVISPRGVPSPEGIGVGEVGSIVLPFAHRTSQTLGGRLAILGPAAALGTALFVLMRGWIWVRTRRRKPPAPVDIPASPAPSL